MTVCFISAFSALTLLVGRHNGHPACERNWVLVCWWCRFDWNFARLIDSDISTSPNTLPILVPHPLFLIQMLQIYNYQRPSEVLRMYAYHVAAGAAPLTPLEELTALPRPPSWWGGLVAPFQRTPTPLLALGPQCSTHTPITLLHPSSFIFLEIWLIIVPVVTTIFITLSSNNILNGDILLWYRLNQVHLENGR